MQRLVKSRFYRDVNEDSKDERGVNFAARYWYWANIFQANLLV